MLKSWLFGLQHVLGKEERLRNSIVQSKLSRDDVNLHENEIALNSEILRSKSGVLGFSYEELYLYHSKQILRQKQQKFTSWGGAQIIISEYILGDI